MAEYYEEDMYNKERYETMSTSSYRNNTLEKGCYTMTKKDARGKNVNVKVFSSGTTGSRIRHAISGEYTKHIVGSNDEELFYKVCVATGNVKDGPITLFFNSEDERDRHF
jgi:hypothetical protein